MCELAKVKTKSGIIFPVFMRDSLPRLLLSTADASNRARRATATQCRGLSHRSVAETETLVIAVLSCPARAGLPRVVIYGVVGMEFFQFAGEGVGVCGRKPGCLSYNVWH
jgi:hypothetical protein